VQPDRLRRSRIPRRSPRPQDVQIEILFCGVCHSDLHQVRNEWHSFAPTTYPCVPGHEIVGRVVKVGDGVKKFKEGDLAAVGCMVDSCRTCANCRRRGRAVLREFPDLSRTTARTRFSAASPTAAIPTASWSMRPSFCACPINSILPRTRRFSVPASPPIRRCAIGKWAKGQKVGIVGLGGLGHMGVKFAHAFGAHVVLFTTSPAKPLTLAAWAPTRW
jgi:uncharacterized zinc-type alcohol dehydrogenase-like protein